MGGNDFNAMPVNDIEDIMQDIQQTAGGITTFELDNDF